MPNFMQMMKQAQQLQSQMAEAQNKLREVVMEGTAGGGMVTVTLNGKMELLKVNIAPKLMVPEDNEILADLIVAAFSDVKSKIEARISKEMGAVTAQLGLPNGMKLPNLS
ncbi:MAG: YbaB/EbfC family nucleoid-associated protein [Holosporales bacterium]|jgi:DNA-binding YbaB/EbfC family protein|nr:YbaB/EbfC family nucleoid-associated protein [Holosporales bacterium]